jgi:glycosyltransferase involved in cell wall biosynthesis
MKNSRILVVGNDLKFLAPIYNYYSHHSSVSVSKYEYEGHVIPDKSHLASLLPGNDILFCEWGLENISWLSKNKLPEQKLIVRIHRHEFTKKFLHETDWEQVDTIILISPVWMERFIELYPSTRAKCRLIYNQVDCDKYDIEKSDDASHHLGLLGILPKLKAPHLGVEILKKLRRYDKRYLLFIKSRLPEEVGWLWRNPEERKYYKRFFFRIKWSGIRKSLVFDPHGDDVTDWFRNIGFILSTSDLEGSHQAIAEGMASGAIPVIRDWPGARKIYPEKYIFRSTVEAADFIRELSASGNLRKEQEAVKEFARIHFDLKVIVKQYDEIFSID